MIMFWLFCNNVQEKELEKEMRGLGLGGQSASAAAEGGDGGGGGEVKKYSNCSFFDNISCDVLDRAQGNRRIQSELYHGQGIRYWCSSSTVVQYE